MEHAMATLNPYLTFDGKTEEAFLFYQSVFGGEFPGGMNKFSDMPDHDDIPEEHLDKVMHVFLPISDGNVLMGSDSMESMGHNVKPGNNVQLSLQPESKQEADKLFDGLSEGGEVIMPMEDTFWNAYFGMFIDKFGIHWMINFSYEKE